MHDSSFMQQVGNYTVIRTSISIVAGTQRLVTNNPNRVCLVFGFNSATGTLDTVPGTAAVTSGIPFSTTIPKHEFTWNSHGPLVQSEWHIRSAAGAGQATIFEVMFQPRGHAED